MDRRRGFYQRPTTNPHACVAHPVRDGEAAAHHLEERRRRRITWGIVAACGLRGGQAIPTHCPYLRRAACVSTYEQIRRVSALDIKLATARDARLCGTATGFGDSHWWNRNAGFGEIDPAWDQ